MLSVLSVAYPLAPVHPDAVGGAEQVLSALDEALVSAGHRSTVLAGAGSRVRGQLVPVPVPEGPLDGGAICAVQAGVRAALRRLTAEQRFDVVHFHGCDCAAYLLDPRWPRPFAQLVTLHVPSDWYGGELFRLERLALVAVSDCQREQLDAQHVSVRATIENGVDLRRWRPLPEGEGSAGEGGGGEGAARHALCLGRICPEKGFDRALRAAHAADVLLFLAGQVFDYPEHVRYFEQEIRPLLDARRRFVGAVRGADKRRLLASAACLVVPSRVAETSSLVAMEALACGTPVITCCPGAPEGLIEHERTGLRVSSEQQLAHALRRVAGLDRGACRRSAERRFDRRRMAASYLELYAALASESSQPGAGAWLAERAS